LLQCLLSSIV